MPEVLILSHSNMERDPRVLRQIEWLNSSGYSVSTVGCGLTPEGSRKHLRMMPHSPIARFLGYLIPSNRLRFEYFFGRQLRRLGQKLHRKFDVLVVNEVEYLGWGSLRAPSAFAPRVLLDIHEQHLGSRARSFLEKLFFDRYWAWQLKNLKVFVAAHGSSISISTVEAEIAKEYSEAFSLPVHVIPNAPKQRNLPTKDFAYSQVRLVHHGMGTIGRGIESAIKSLALLPHHFTLDLVVFTGRGFRARCEKLARKHGVTERVKFVEPVPLSELLSLLSEYTIAVVVIPPISRGNLNTLPNKFFESLHAGLPVLVGPNKSMRNIVKTYDCGWVTNDWSAEAIAETLSTLTLEKIRDKTLNVRSATAVLNEQASSKTFIDMLTP